MSATSRHNRRLRAWQLKQADENEKQADIEMTELMKKLEDPWRGVRYEHRDCRFPDPYDNEIGGHAFIKESLYLRWFHYRFTYSHNITEASIIEIREFLSELDCFFYVSYPVVYVEDKYQFILFKLRFA